MPPQSYVAKARPLSQQHSETGCLGNGGLVSQMGLSIMNVELKFLLRWWENYEVGPGWRKDITEGMSLKGIFYSWHVLFFFSSWPP